MNKYQNSKIYIIRSPNNNKFYIGSTVSPLDKRLISHKHDYKRYQAGKFNYITSFKLFESGSPSIELLELYPCNSLKELIKREGDLIRQHKDTVVNHRIEGRGCNEYYQDNKSKKHAYYQAHKAEKQRYYEANKEKAKARQREQYEEEKAILITCQCGRVIQKPSLKPHLKTKFHLDHIQ